jgi:hypothetical protein
MNGNCQGLHPGIVPGGLCDDFPFYIGGTLSKTSLVTNCVRALRPVEAKAA